MKKLLLIIIFLSVPITSHAMRFDGTDDGVTIGNQSELHASTSNLTISAWIRPNDLTAGVKGVVGMSGIGAGVVPYMMEFNRTAARFSFAQAGTGSGNVSVTNTTNLQIGNWYHIVATRKFNSTIDWSVNLYLNGLPNGSGTIQRSGITSQVLGIGRYGGHTLYFNGEIADVRIYNRALTPQEINALYKGYGTYNGLIARWVLDGNALPFVPSANGKFHGFQTGGVLKGPLPPAVKLFDNYK